MQSDGRGCVAAALWRISLDHEDINDEDLEEAEVEAAVSAYRTGEAARMVGQRVRRTFPGFGDLVGEVTAWAAGERRGAWQPVTFTVVYLHGHSERLSWEEVRSQPPRRAAPRAVRGGG